MQKFSVESYKIFSRDRINLHKFLAEYDISLLREYKLDQILLGNKFFALNHYYWHDIR
jgi:hypothetical protein